MSCKRRSYIFRVHLNLELKQRKKTKAQKNPFDCEINKLVLTHAIECRLMLKNGLRESCKQNVREWIAECKMTHAYPKLYTQQTKTTE